MESIGTTSVWNCRPGIFNLSFVIYQCVRNRISGMFEWKLEMHRKSNVYSDESVFPFRYTRFSLWSHIYCSRICLRKWIRPTVNNNKIINYAIAVVVQLAFAGGRARSREEKAARAHTQFTAHIIIINCMVSNNDDDAGRQSSRTLVRRNGIETARTVRSNYYYLWKLGKFCELCSCLVG